jgi:hypothetical protein
MEEFGFGVLRDFDGGVEDTRAIACTLILSHTHSHTCVRIHIEYTRFGVRVAGLWVRVRVSGVWFVKSAPIPRLPNPKPEPQARIQTCPNP